MCGWLRSRERLGRLLDLGQRLRRARGSERSGGERPQDVQDASGARAGDSIAREARRRSECNHASRSQLASEDHLSRSPSSRARYAAEDVKAIGIARASGH